MALIEKGRNPAHQPVLLQETIRALAIRKDGLYVDGTFGRGGHARAILEALSSEGRLLGMDKDPEAFAVGNALAQKDKRFFMVQSSIEDIARVVAEQNWSGRVNGMLFDLGVSSPQLERVERGFSFLRDGPLDMRMNPAAGQSAAEWLAGAKEKDIAEVLKRYGEERYYRRITRAIVRARHIEPLTRTGQLARVVAQAHPRWEAGKHPATRVFQAIRIYINNELEELRAALGQAVTVLAAKGRLAVISFHSLEDRMTKRLFRQHARGEILPPELPIRANDSRASLRIVGKPIWPTAAEISSNPRARSARLRVAEKLACHA